MVGRLGKFNATLGPMILEPHKMHHDRHKDRHNRCCLKVIWKDQDIKPGVFFFFKKRVFKCLFFPPIKMCGTFSSSNLTISFFLASVMVSLQGGKVDGIPILRPLKLDDFTHSKAKVNSRKLLQVTLRLCMGP